MIISEEKGNPLLKRVSGARFESLLKCIYYGIDQHGIVPLEKISKVMYPCYNLYNKC